MLAGLSFCHRARKGAQEDDICDRDWEAACPSGWKKLLASPPIVLVVTVGRERRTTKQSEHIYFSEQLKAWRKVLGWRRLQR